MRAVNIQRDKFKQSYYNDKHQDPLVIKDRQEYISLMDELALRQPIWLQLPLLEFEAMKERMPPEGVLVHHYTVAGTPMVEVHVVSMTLSTLGVPRCRSVGSFPCASLAALHLKTLS